MNIDAIITKSSPQAIVESIRKALVKGIGGKPITDMRLVDSSNEESVILISNTQLSQELADAFWLGYKKALE